MKGPRSSYKCSPDKCKLALLFSLILSLLVFSLFFEATQKQKDRHVDDPSLLQMRAFLSEESAFSPSLPVLSLLCEKGEPTGHLYLYDSKGSHGSDLKVGVENAFVTPASSTTLPTLLLRAGESFDPGAVSLSLPFLTRAGDFPTSHVSSYKNVLLVPGKTPYSVNTARFNALAAKAGFDGFLDHANVHLFLNRKNMGVYHLVQNFSSSFLASRYHFKRSDDVEKEEGTEAKVFNAFQLQDLFSADLNREEARAALEEKVDIRSLLTLYAMNVLINNPRFPDYQFRAFRARTPLPDSDLPYQDGRVYFVTGGADLAFQQKADAFDDLMEQRGYGADSIFPHLMEADAYRQLFLQVLGMLRRDCFTDEGMHFHNPFLDADLQQYFHTSKQEVLAKAPKGSLADWLRSPARDESAAKVGAPLYFSEISAKGSFDSFRITNRGTQTVSLGNLFVSDDPADPLRFRLPAINLSPGDSILIHGARNKEQIGSYLCNFSLKSGETLCLFDGKTFLDTRKIPPMSDSEICIILPNGRLLFRLRH